ncbi:MAG: MBL fold metallo-hydrolase, partial [Dehalococcoidia bacterium]|nr:MBL fold metallo-hydrolase [Dehalococcoidia bacterium]
MSVQSLWFFRAGALLTEASSLWFGQRGAPFETPVTYALLDTTDGPWLIDCGLATGAVSDPTGWYGMAGARVRLTPRQTLAACLAEAGVDPGDVAGVALTHLHFDHCGGLADLAADTPVYVHDR